MLRSSVAEPSMVPGPISSSSCARSCSRVSQVGLTQVTDSSFSCRSRWRDRVVLPTPAGPLRNSDCTLLLNRSSSFSNAYRIECDANTGRAASGANGLASSLYCSRNKRTESAGNILIGSYPQDTRSYLMALGANRNWSGRQDLNRPRICESVCRLRVLLERKRDAERPAFCIKKPLAPRRGSAC